MTPLQNSREMVGKPQRPIMRLKAGGIFSRFWYCSSMKWAMASSRHISPGRRNATAHRGRESSFPPGPMRPVSTISGIWFQYRTPRIMGRAQASRVTISSARCFSGDRCFP